MNISKSLLLLSVVFFTGLQFSRAQSTDRTKVIPLEQFVGYYDVGVKPNRPFFKSRWYLRDGKLFTIYDSDRDRIFEPYKGGRLKPTIFLSEEEVSVTDEDSTYYQVLNFENDQLKSFRIIRPRSEWPTDLYGYRNEKLSKLAIDTEHALVYNHSTEHFRFHYSAIDTAVVPLLAQLLEERYTSLIESFQIKEMPITTLRIYPDQDTYHNAVLTPGAPGWQMGRAWDHDEIRMLSLVVARKITGEDMDLKALVVHEFVHCLHLNLIGEGTRAPGWLWEGVAMYKGCCDWTDVKSLDYLKKGKFPSLRQIERDRSFQMKYDLGYYIIEFIDLEYSWDKVLQLIISNGDIRKTLNLTTRAFETRFYAFLSAKYLN